jgi:predicted nucleic acid-binding protein
MIAVADAGPLNYLVLASAVDVLAPLYTRVLVPRTVAEELLQAGTPVAVRTWMTRRGLRSYQIRPSIPRWRRSMPANAQPSPSRFCSVPTSS